MTNVFVAAPSPLWMGAGYWLLRCRCWRLSRSSPACEGGPMINFSSSCLHCQVRIIWDTNTSRRQVLGSVMGCYIKCLNFQTLTKTEDWSHCCGTANWSATCDTTSHIQAMLHVLAAPLRSSSSASANRRAAESGPSVWALWSVWKTQTGFSFPDSNIPQFLLLQSFGD